LPDRSLLSDEEIREIVLAVRPKIVLVSDKYYALHGKRWGYVSVVPADIEAANGFVGDAIFIVDSDDPALWMLMESYKANGNMVSRLE